MDTLMVWKWRKHKVPLEVHRVSLRDSLNQSVDDKAVSWSMVFRGRLLSLNSWKKAKYPIRRSFVNLWLELSLVTLDNMWKSGHYWFLMTKNRVHSRRDIYVGTHDETSSVAFPLNSGISKKIFKLQLLRFLPPPFPRPQKEDLGTHFDQLKHLFSVSFPFFSFTYVFGHIFVLWEGDTPVRSI